MFIEYHKRHRSSVDPTKAMAVAVEDCLKWVFDNCNFLQIVFKRQKRDWERHI